MTAADARAELARMVATLTEATQEDRARRLLERVSTRVDALELRSALVEIGALALVAAAPVTDAKGVRAQPAPVS